jgi:hypothetical protein
MNLALYPSRVRSSELLGVTPQLCIEHVCDLSETHKLWPFLNPELKTGIKSVLLPVGRQQPQKCRNRFTRLHPLAPGIFMLCVVELARKTEVVVWTIP